MIPIRRDLHFNLKPADVTHWHAYGPEVSNLLNAMSIFFPVGERFFIHSVRQLRSRIDDAELQQAITAFIGQEAMHGREHEQYNAALTQAGFPAAQLEAQVHALLELAKKTLTPKQQLALTIALEHFTAILADLLLTEPRLLEGAGPRLASLWRWHALEETEHKAVAFDVFAAVTRSDRHAYLLRSSGLLFATLIFTSMFMLYQLQLSRADAVSGGIKGWLRYVDYLFGQPGLLRRYTRPWLHWFRPGFHPWDHDNRRLLAGIDDLVQAVDPLPKAA